MSVSRKCLSYALSHHSKTIWKEDEAGGLALIDAGQINGLATRLRKLYPPEKCFLLYEGTFAENVAELSPMLVELSSDPHQLALELRDLDGLCASLPILTLIQTHKSTAQWLRHLRSLLRLQMDGSEYLWRFADTQMLQATSMIMTSEQRIAVFGGCRSWWIVTADGTPKDMAFSTAKQNAETTQPLRLNASQEHALLAQIAPFMLASQLRSMDARFKNQLTHAEQITFSAKCIEDARGEFLDEDTELLSWALSKWQEVPHAQD